jgi:transglutaminase-like putative cysteine protease
MKRAIRQIALFGLTLALARAAEDAPEWVKQLATTAVPSYSAKVDSVTLLQEEAVTVDPTGRRTMRERGAIKILQPGGERIEAYRTYNTRTGRIRDFQGWLLPPGGKPTAYPKNRVIDVALSQNYVYDEARARVLACGTAEPGSVFAWEITEEERTVFTQDSYRFQGRSPVLQSRFLLTLPAGWETKSVIFNHEALEPQVSGNTYTWEMRNLPWIEREDHSLEIGSLAPRLAVSYFPNSDNPGSLVGLKDWAAVSSWLATLVDPAADATDTVRAKAGQLTANAPNDLAKIRAIAAFTQQTNYVEVALNLTRGGGYTPHRAQDTLAKNYGDCKDKATLMRALLKAVGIDSYLTTITAGDRNYVRPEWASPMQFNHAIVAVRVANDVTLPTVLPETPMGRLLIFDPTDPITPLGDLPDEEQGSHALVIAGDRGALLEMPRLPASAKRIESTVAGTLDTSGHLEAKIDRQYFGQSAVPLRGVEKLRGGDELKKRFERGFTRSLGAATVHAVATAPGTEENGLSVHMELAAERFAQNMSGRLYVVRAGMLASGGEYSFSSKQRSSPVKLKSDLRHDSIRIQLPAGFQVDEIPQPIKIDGPYGRLEASWTVRNGEIAMSDTLEVREQVVPVSDYGKVREFFEQVSGAAFAPVVLVEK